MTRAHFGFCDLPLAVIMLAAEAVASTADILSIALNQAGEDVSGCL